MGWLRRNLFSGWASGLATLLIVALGLDLLPGFVQWSVTQAVLAPDAGLCRALDGTGACWGVIAEKWRLILFGRYPYAEHWRPALVTLLLVALFVFSAVARLRMSRLTLAWGMTLPLCLMLMAGGVFSLTAVETALWGGLPLTLLLSLGAIGCALPFGVLLALGRRSALPAMRALCSVYIELVRGLPLIPVLFMAAFLFPLFLPRGLGADVLLRVLVALVLFAAAHLAEVVRGGLQAVPQGQFDTARALGFNQWQVQRYVILPQALRAALPALANSFIAIFKDVSLVTVVSLYELTGSLSLALAGDADWRPYFLEGYLFIGAIYWSGCFALSRYSQRLETRLSRN
ncbi:amino acid ABC transporter permease [Propionivibrio sp.]|uniref:amino acid ABC transporter permease n=1 Tax=Propionivibrio sp. TaxID=2212460 RepID=UPI003BF298D1